MGIGAAMSWTELAKAKKFFSRAVFSALLFHNNIFYFPGLKVTHTESICLNEQLFELSNFCCESVALNYTFF